jgi:Ran GTPase-activating protein (RanGAP) involved in mRNA processing and transport
MIAKGYYRNNHITHLNLRGNNITDESAEVIVTHLKGVKQNYLRALNLSDNMISELVAVELIKAANPLNRPVCHLGKQVDLLFSPL